MTALAADTGFVDILIAEDDEIMRRSLRYLFEGEGYRCTEAEDGRAAVESALRAPPRCAILDLMMPLLDGFAVARALRSDVRTRGVHIHCLTGRSDASARAEAADAGIEAFMTKPLDPSHLLQLVHKQLRCPQVLQAWGLSLTDAREQLDRWERAGYDGLEATCEDGVNFTVRCTAAPRVENPNKVGALADRRR